MTIWSLREAAAVDGCGDFLLKRWPDGYVIFDQATGSVQAFNMIAGELFELLLGRNGVSEVDLASSLVQGEPTEEEVTMVRRSLLQFEALGLAECAQE